MDRWTQDEEVTLVGKLPDNALNVTVSVTKVNGTPVIVDQPCQQIIVSIFIYRFYPPDVGDYIWQMKGIHPQTGKLHTIEDSFVYGGWVDSLLKPEHLAMLAKEDTVLTRATPEDLIPLAKEDSLESLSKETTVLTRASSAELEPLAKEDSLSPLAREASLAPLAKESSLLPLAQEASLALLAKEATLLMRPTLAEIKQFTVTRILTAPRALELIAKSVSQYYLGQTATLVVMSTYAGAPTDVNMWVTVYYPNDNVWINETQMTPLGTTGLYTHSFLIPEDAPLGVYKVKYKAIKSIAAQEIPDTFDADGAPANWLVMFGTWNVSNHILTQSESDFSYKVINWEDELSLDWRNYTFEADIRDDTTTGNNELGIIIRSKAHTLGYWLRYVRSTGQITIYKNNSGTNNLKPYTINRGQWYRFKIEVSGYRIKGYIDDVLQFDWLDLNGATLMDGTVMTKGTSLYSVKNVLITIPAQEYQEFEISDFIVNPAPGQIEFIAE